MSQRTRRYCLTLNNPTDEEIASLLDVQEGTLKRGFIALEVGAEGTPHLQGFVHLKNAKTGTALKKMLGSDRWHWAKANGTDFENWAYICEDNEGKVRRLAHPMGRQASRGRRTGCMGLNPHDD